MCKWIPDGHDVKQAVMRGNWRWHGNGRSKHDDVIQEYQNEALNDSVSA